MKEFIEKLIGRLKKYQIEYKSGFGELTDETVFRVIENVIYTVKELAEEHKGGWIPCSERLPEVNGWYLVAVEYKYGTEHRGYKYDLTWFEDGFWISSAEVIAWQPLPEPYKERDKKG